MILYITPENRHLYRKQVDQYFRIRKTVFHDTLKWDVQTHGDMEYDKYDSMPCTYVLYLTSTGEVSGGLRQMRMTGPTLTWEKFADMVEDRTQIFSAKVTETTRFVIRPQEKDVRVSSGVNRTAIELCNASLEYGLSQGITRHVAICEERVVKLTRLFGVQCQTIGRRATSNGDDILCVSWEVSSASLEKLAWVKSHYAVAS
ncbi:hypothetical protein MRS76_15615 [Rhizobiaceae bacterium n13]|uniref:Acyl-homoserine-lactone synthase n=1 Tax=Ferirhizobium litorale TaxID=2927786 RepID=A0AAE3QF23_9HYPH|nr:acyl-homoserine-lactone synthase [Fererhizobium litorale]MDI7863383.1 hypothetical protein [Fererhizobium litorale]MDI7922340.1 hypothetical protein [Fererhizobium litorale]